MSSDLRTFVARDLRLHPRVGYQGLVSAPDAGDTLAAALPPLVPFRSDYYGALSVIDWDHRLPSRALALRIYAYYTADSFAAGEEAYDDRLEIIGARDRFPEFDVPDFDGLAADEAYEVELSPTGELGRCRLTSAWRRDIARRDAASAIDVATRSPEFQELRRTVPRRPAQLGDLEAVSWTPPCESEYQAWTIDVWYLLAFDGRTGTGRSFLVDIDAGKVVGTRDFSVRAG